MKINNISELKTNLKGVKRKKKKEKKLNNQIDREADLKLNNKLSKIEKLTYKKNWKNITKEYFKIVTSELLALEILYKIDTLQLYTGFDVFNEAMLVKEKMQIESEDYEKFCKRYQSLLAFAFDLLGDYFINPRQRYKTMIALLEKKQETENNNVIELLKD